MANFLMNFFYEFFYEFFDEFFTNFLTYKLSTIASFILLSLSFDKHCQRKFKWQKDVIFFSHFAIIEETASAYCTHFMRNSNLHPYITPAAAISN